MGQVSRGRVDYQEGYFVCFPSTICIRVAQVIGGQFLTAFSLAGGYKVIIDNSKFNLLQANDKIFSGPGSE